MHTVLACAVQMERCSLEQLRGHVLLCLRCSWGSVGTATAFALAAIGNAAASDFHRCSSSSFTVAQTSAANSGSGSSGVASARSGASTGSSSGGSTAGAAGGGKVGVDREQQSELLDLPGALPAVVLSPRQQRAGLGALGAAGVGAGSASERRNSSDVTDLRLGHGPGSVPVRKVSKPMIVTSFSEEEGASTLAPPAAAAAAGSRVPFVLGGNDDSAADSVHVCWLILQYSTLLL